MLTYFKNYFIAGLGKKFATKLLLYFPPHLKHVATLLPCEITTLRNTKDQKWCIIALFALNSTLYSLIIFSTFNGAPTN